MSRVLFIATKNNIARIASKFKKKQTAVEINRLQQVFANELLLADDLIQTKVLKYLGAISNGKRKIVVDIENTIKAIIRSFYVLKSIF